MIYDYKYLIILNHEFGWKFPLIDLQISYGEIMDTGVQKWCYPKSPWDVMAFNANGLQWSDDFDILGVSRS